MRSALGKLALLAATAWAILLALELGLRVSGYDPLRSFERGRELILRPSADPGLRYELRPGAAGSAWGTDVRVNAQGFRGALPPPVSLERARVVLLGDSIAFGILVREEFTAAVKLQALLRAQGGPVDVLNLGVGGYDTLQEVALLELRGFSLEPDLIVLVYCLNDIGVVSTNQEYIERLAERRDRWLFRLALVQWVSDRLARREHATWMDRMNDPEIFRRTYRGQIEDVRSDPRVRDLMAAASDEFPSNWYREPDKVGRLRFAFARLSEVARARRVPVVVAIVPWLMGDGSRYPHAAAHAIVEHEARRAGFAQVDLLEAFSAAGLQRLRRVPNDPMHPNPRGHALIAEELAPVVQAMLLER